MKLEIVGQHRAKYTFRRPEYILLVLQRHGKCLHRHLHRHPLSSLFFTYDVTFPFIQISAFHQAIIICWLLTS